MGGAELGGLIADRYRLQAVLRRGQMGAVWLAADELRHRQVAVKEIPWLPQPGAEGQESRRGRAVREARALARLGHPNIVGIYDVVHDDGRLWMAMQLAPFRFPYRSLRDVVHDDGPLPPVWAARLGVQVLSAVHAAHGAGVLHRDINPGNVLVGPAEQVMLAGFGMVTGDGTAAVTTPEACTGSAAYMAPERARGEPATPAADLWSLGATLYAAVEGRPPFHRDGKAAVLTAVIGDYVDPPSRAGPLWPLLSALLCKDPSVRPDAAEAERLLQTAAGSSRSAQSASLAAEATHPAVRASSAHGTERMHRPNGASSNPAASNPSPRQPAQTGSAVSAPDFIPGFGPRDDLPASQTPASGHRTEERPPPGRGRRRWQLLAVTTVAALVAAIVAAIDLTPKNTAGHHTAAPAPRAASRGYPAAMPGHQRLSPAPTAPQARPALPRRPATPRPSGPSSPAPGHGGLGALPRGFAWYHDPTGFSIGRPATWPISHQGHLVYIQDPHSGRFLIIDQTTHPKPSPLADWRRQEAARISTFPGYHRIRLRAVHYAQAERAADWEFTYDNNGQLTQVLNRNILVGAHHAYALYWSTPASQWKTSYHYFRAFAATFRPAPGTSQQR